MGLLRSDSFKVSPEFLRKLVTERLERDSQYLGNYVAAGLDVSSSTCQSAC